MNKNRIHLLALGLLLILVAFTFKDLRTFSYVEYDDPAFLTENPIVLKGLSAEGLSWAFTHQNDDTQLRAGTENLWLPLTWISHMIDVELFGENWGLHHLTSLLLHIISTALVFRLALKLRIHTTGAFIAAALFALHPLHVETVAWLSDRKGCLSSALALASLLAYLSAKGRKLSIGLFLLALLAKPSVVILPALLVLINSYMDRPKLNRSWLPTNLKDTAPWWIPALLVSGVTLYFQAQGSLNNPSHSLGTALIQMPAQWSFYAYRCLIPTNLAFHYTATTPFNQAWFSALSLIAFPLLGYYAWKKRRSHPILLFALSWAFFCWLPTSGLAYVGTSFTTDRYSYLLLIGPFLAIGSFCKDWLSLGSKPGYVVLSALTLGLAWVASQQASVWRNTDSLYRHAIQAQPHDRVTNLNYGVLLLRSRNDSAALAQLQATSENFPPKASVEYHLAIAHRRLGQDQQALKSYRRALQIDPAYADAWLNYGLLLAEQQRHEDFEEIRDAYRQAVKHSHALDPRPLLLLCELELKNGNRAEAKRILNQLSTLSIKAPSQRRFKEELEARVH